MPTEESAAPATKKEASSGVYTVDVNGKSYVAEVNSAGDVNVSINGRTYTTKVSEGGEVSTTAPVADSSGVEIPAPLAGNIFKVLVHPGDVVEEGQVVMILEAMKMETAVSATKDGVVASIGVKPGDKVVVGDTLLSLA